MKRYSLPLIMLLNRVPSISRSQVTHEPPFVAAQRELPGLDLNYITLIKLKFNNLNFIHLPRTERRRPRPMREGAAPLAAQVGETHLDVDRRRRQRRRRTDPALPVAGFTCKVDHP